MKKAQLVPILLISICTALIGQGNLKAEYFNGPNFEEYVGSNFVSHLDLFWDRQAPYPGLNPHYCSVIYIGQLQTPRSGDITFTARVDDGILVWIDDVLVIENWQLNDVGYSEGKIYLEAHTNYDIKIEYFNALNEAELRLLWKLPRDPKSGWFSNWLSGDEPVIIPSKYFMPLSKEPVAEVPATLESVPEPVKKVKPQPKIEVKPSPKPIPKKEVIADTPKTAILNTYQKYIPKSVEFERAKSEILSVSHPDLNKLAAFLSSNPSRKIKIEGHTDYVGDPAKNLALSEKRAKAVARYLVKNGVHYTQIISALGYGGSKPIAKSDGKKYHPENRRVEFIIE